MGNIYGTWRGSEDSLPSVATGSHTDAIPLSGMYDGTLGVIGGIAAVAALRQAVRLVPGTSMLRACSSRMPYCERGSLEFEVLPTSFAITAFFASGFQA